MIFSEKMSLIIQKLISISWMLDATPEILHDLVQYCLYCENKFYVT